MCLRAHDVVLHWDSSFIDWLVLEPTRRMVFVLLSVFSYLCCFFFSSRKKKKKTSLDSCVPSVGVSGVTLREMKDGSF